MIETVLIVRHAVRTRVIVPSLSLSPIPHSSCGTRSDNGDTFLHTLLPVLALRVDLQVYTS